jgi:hypothetical protein
LPTGLFLAIDFLSSISTLPPAFKKILVGNQKIIILYEALKKFVIEYFVQTGSLRYNSTASTKSGVHAIWLE